MLIGHGTMNLTRPSTNNHDTLTRKKSLDCYCTYVMFPLSVLPRSPLPMQDNASPRGERRGGEDDGADTHTRIHSLT